MMNLVLVVPWSIEPTNTSSPDIFSSSPSSSYSSSSSFSEFVKRKQRKQNRAYMGVGVSEWIR